MGLPEGKGVEITALGRYEVRSRAIHTGRHCCYFPLLSQGEFEEGRRLGKGTMYYANGDRAYGDFGTTTFHKHRSLLHGEEYMLGQPNGNVGWGAVLSCTFIVCFRELHL